ncbi:MAG: hypothetical protein ACI80K_003210 [Paracoccaceae bacterium]|jgi:hypothetical protein
MARGPIASGLTLLGPTGLNWGCVGIRVGERDGVAPILRNVHARNQRSPTRKLGSFARLSLRTSSRGARPLAVRYCHVLLLSET